MKKHILFILMMAFAFVSFAQQPIKAEFPKATLADKGSGQLTSSEITKAGELKVTESGLKIKSFILTYKNNNGDMVSLRSNSAKLTEEMIREMKNLDKGQKFIIEKIRVVKNDGVEFELATMIFYKD